MIHLELDLGEVDYDALVERFLPQVTQQLRQKGGALGSLAGNMSESMARGIVQRMSRESKERLAVELLNGQQEHIIETIEAMAKSQGVEIFIQSLTASVEE